MKAKFIITIVLCFFISISANAQDPSQKILKEMLGSNKGVAKKLPDTYTFDWEYKTNMKMVGKKKSDNQTVEMNFLLSSNNDYYGMQSVNEETRKMAGDIYMIFDFNAEAMVMFMDANGTKQAMINKLKNPKSKKISDKNRNYKFKEIGSKTILGYECHGIEIENKNSIAQLYFTLDAPVNFSAFFAFSSEAAPKGFSDPQLFDVLKEEALLMEMHFLSKKKNHKMIMTPISLEQKKIEYRKKDYQIMSMNPMNFISK